MTNSDNTEFVLICCKYPREMHLLVQTLNDKLAAYYRVAYTPMRAVFYSRCPERRPHMVVDISDCHKHIGLKPIKVYTDDFDESCYFALKGVPVCNLMPYENALKDIIEYIGGKE